MDISLLNTVLDISQAYWGDNNDNINSFIEYTEKMKSYNIEQYAPVKESSGGDWINAVRNKQGNKNSGYSGYKFLGTFASHSETVSDNGLYNNRINNRANIPMVMNVDVYVYYIFSYKIKHNLIKTLFY